MLRVVASLVFVFAASGVARASPCEQEATELYKHLELESERAGRWNTIWAILFGAAVVGQVAFAVAEVDPLGRDYTQDTKETLIVGASKATLAVGSKVILPLRIPVPARTQDACVDVQTLRTALAVAAKREKRSFWLTHVGGTVINLAGATILTVRRSFKVGAISFAISYPIGPASAYTQPRRSWKLYREKQPTWLVGATGTADGAQLWIGGQW